MFQLSPDKKEKLDSIVYKSNFYPFGSSKYEEKDQLKDFVGREEEIEIFKQKIYEMLHSGSAKAIRLSGPPGVGKTTLFNFVKKYIEYWRRMAKDPKHQAEFAESHYSPFDFEECIVFSAYFQRPSDKFSFKSIWHKMMDSLQAGFEKETGEAVNLPFYVAILIVSRLIEFKPDLVIETIYKKKEVQNPTEIKKLSSALISLGKKGTEALQKIFNDIKAEFREYVSNLFPNLNEKFTRGYNSLMENLFRCFDEDDSYWEDMTEGKTFSNEDDAIEYFSDLSKLIKILTGKNPIFLIGIDEFAKSDEADPAKDFQTMGNSLLRMRNELQLILFTLISTDQDWTNFDNSFEETNPLKGQLEGFWNTILLKSLKEEDVIKLCNNRMNLLFWRHHETERESMYPSYPFNDEVFRFLYKEHNKNLRETLKALNDFWVYIKAGNPIPTLVSEFDCLKHFVVQKKSKATYLSFKDLAKHHKEIIKKYYETLSEKQDNKTRSTKIEIVIEKAWIALKNEKKEISSVQHEPKCKILDDEKQYRKPDVLVNINGSLSTELRRSIEFQIKAYGPNSEVGLKEIDSSLVLLNQGYTDLLFFIITGKGLHPEAEAAVTQLEKEMPGRIRRNPLSKPDQLYALYYLAVFEDLNQKSIENVPEEARRLLETIMMIKIEDLIKEVIELPFREISNKAFSATDQQDLGITPRSDLINIAETKSDPILSPPNDIKIENSEIEMPPKQVKYADWVNDIPWCKDYSYELTQLFKYVHDRPNKYRQKFTTTTFLSHMGTDTLFDRDRFTKLVKLLEENRIIVKVKSSYELTSTGSDLLKKMKQHNFECQLLSD